MNTLATELVQLFHFLNAETQTVYDSETQTIPAGLFVLYIVVLANSKLGSK